MMESTSVIAVFFQEALCVLYKNVHIFTIVHCAQCTVTTVQYKMLSSYTSDFCCPAGRDGGQWRVVDICPWWGITPVLLGHIYPSCPAFSSLYVPEPHYVQYTAASTSNHENKKVNLGKHRRPSSWSWDQKILLQSFGL